MPKRNYKDGFRGERMACIQRRCMRSRRSKDLVNTLVCFAEVLDEVCIRRLADQSLGTLIKGNR